MIKSVLFFPELSSRIETLLEVGLNRRWLWGFFVFRQSAGLGALEGGHSSVEFLVGAYKLGLGLHININTFRIDLYKRRKYLWQFDVISQCSLEVVVSFIAPLEGITVASFGRANIKISAWAITDIVHKLIATSFVVLIGMFAVLGLWEGEVPLSWSFELCEFVNFILGEETAIVIADVCVSSGSIGAVVDDLALRWDHSISLHL